MKNKVLLLFVGLLGVVGCSYAQQLSGEWYGVGKVNKQGEHSSYLSELILKQTGSKVTGEYNYFFKSASVKTKVTGTYYASTRTLELKAVPVLNYKAQNINGADCPMEGSFTLRISRVETSLMGQFNPTLNYRLTCPAINIKLIKQTDQPNLKEELQKEIDNPLESLLSMEPDKPSAISKEDAIKIKATENLVRRAFEANPVIDVFADSLKVTLYDNGEVDNDTISLFYNRQLIAHKNMLSDKPLTFMLPLDTSINEIAMYAENLGSIAPNTALCVVYAGDQRFELNLASTFIKNAAIRFRKIIKNPRLFE